MLYIETVVNKKHERKKHMKTNYIGKIIGNRVLVICQGKNGQFLQIPHVDMMKEDGLVMVAVQGTPKAPLKYLTQKEVALFLNGRGIDGSVLETPAEMRIRHQKEHEELMKDPEYRKMIEEIRKERNRVAA
jgi:hypothetical protein